MTVSNQKNSAGNFFEQNQKAIVGGITAIVILIIGYMAYTYLYQKPREREAVNAIYMAEMQFERDSFENALLSPGAGNMGLLDIIDEYRGTKTANLAVYYAGISYLKLGKYEAAISYLKDFKAKGKLTPITKNGALGDAYSELEDFDKAIEYYKKATTVGKNNYLTPYYLKKLGLLYERQERYKDALAVYQEIADKYPESTDGFNIRKYIDNVQYSLNMN